MFESMLRSSVFKSNIIFSIFVLIWQESPSSDSLCNVPGESSAAVDDRLFLYVNR